MSGPAFQTFPGTSGFYASCDDVNLLDADTAHGQQSVGLWISNADAAMSIATPPVASKFGTTCILMQANAGGTPDCQMRAVGVDIAGSTEYTYSVWVLAKEAGLIGQLRTQFDGNEYSSSVPLSTSAWTELTKTVTSDASPTTNTIHVRLSKDGGGNFVSGEGAYVSALCLREGTDATFTPSLRIVGDVDLRAMVAADDWTAAANQRMIDKRATANHGWKFMIATSGDVQFWWGDGSTDYGEGTSLYSFTNGEPTEIRVTAEPDTGDVVWYQDGTQVDTDNIAAAPITPDYDSGVAAIGASSSGTSELFDGDIYWAEVRDGIDGPVVARWDATQALGEAT